MSSQSDNMQSEYDQEDNSGEQSDELLSGAEEGEVDLDDELAGISGDESGEQEQSD